MMIWVNNMGLRAMVCVLCTCFPLWFLREFGCVKCGCVQCVKSVWRKAHVCECCTLQKPRCEFDGFETKCVFLYVMSLCTVHLWSCGTIYVHYMCMSCVRAPLKLWHYICTLYVYAMCPCTSKGVIMAYNHSFRGVRASQMTSNVMTEADDSELPLWQRVLFSRPTMDERRARMVVDEALLHTL